MELQFLGERGLEGNENGTRQALCNLYSVCSFDSGKKMKLKCKRNHILPLKTAGPWAAFLSRGLCCVVCFLFLKNISLFCKKKHSGINLCDLLREKKINTEKFTFYNIIKQIVFKLQKYLRQL